MLSLCLRGKGMRDKGSDPFVPLPLCSSRLLTGKTEVTSILVRYWVRQRRRMNRSCLLAALAALYVLQ